MRTYNPNGHSAHGAGMARSRVLVFATAWHHGLCVVVREKARMDMNWMFVLLVAWGALGTIGTVWGAWLTWGGKTAEEASE